MNVSKSLAPDQARYWVDILSDLSWVQTETKLFVKVAGRKELSISLKYFIQ